VKADGGEKGNRTLRTQEGQDLCTSTLGGAKEAPENKVTLKVGRCSRR